MKRIGELFGAGGCRHSRSVCSRCRWNGIGQGWVVLAWLGIIGCIGLAFAWEGLTALFG